MSQVSLLREELELCQARMFCVNSVDAGVPVGVFSFTPFIVRASTPPNATPKPDTGPPGAPQPCSCAVDPVVGAISLFNTRWKLHTDLSEAKEPAATMDHIIASADSDSE